mgnify:CR=1 FL=1
MKPKFSMYMILPCHFLFSSHHKALGLLWDPHIPGCILGMHKSSILSDPEETHWKFLKALPESNQYIIVQVWQFHMHMQTTTIKNLNKLIWVLLINRTIISLRWYNTQTLAFPALQCTAITLFGSDISHSHCTVK